MARCPSCPFPPCHHRQRTVRPPPLPEALSSAHWGGLIGLGGAEFRLPLLIGAFRFAALQAVILNKAMSLVVVRLRTAVPGSDSPLLCLVAAHWSIIVNLLAGSLLGAWFGGGGRRVCPHTHCIALLPCCLSR